MRSFTISLCLVLWSHRLAHALPKSRPSCGSLLDVLIRACGQPDLAEPQFCCRAINAYNNAECWCQPASLAAAAELSTNSYAFSARVRYCNVTKPLIPSIPRRGSPGLPSTCSKSTAISVEVNSAGQKCPHPGALRKTRQRALKHLDSLSLVGLSTQSVSQFHAKVGRLLTKNVKFASIGLIGFSGIEKTTAYLLARQEVSGSTMPWIPSANAGLQENKRWRSPEYVSYTVVFKISGRHQYRYMFVRFASCSARILDLRTVEPGVISAISAQFYYNDTFDALSQYNVPAAKLCARVKTACGDKSPYKSVSECQTFMSVLWKSNKVTCNNLRNPILPTRALFGNTMSCRHTYAMMAMTEPETYCPFVGKPPSGNCAAKMCEPGYEANMFGNEGQRYIYSASFSCNSDTGECVELWPETTS